MPGSTFGELFRVTNFGESHGPAIGCVIDGWNVSVSTEMVDLLAASRAYEENLAVVRNARQMAAKALAIGR